MNIPAPHLIFLAFLGVFLVTNRENALRIFPVSSFANANERLFANALLRLQRERKRFSRFFVLALRIFPVSSFANANERLSTNTYLHLLNSFLSCAVLTNDSQKREALAKTKKMC